LRLRPTRQIPVHESSQPSYWVIVLQQGLQLGDSSGRQVLNG